MCSYATDRWVSRGVDAEGDDLVVAGELGGGGSIVDVLYSKADIRLHELATVQMFWKKV